MSGTALGVVLIVVAAFFEGFAQIAWKLSAERIHQRLRWIVLGAIAYGTEIPLYTYALTIVDVTVAFAMGSLTFIAVALLSRFLLGEKISTKRAVGLLLILCGVAFMGGEA